MICNSHINNEIPYFCYTCQKIYHIECLKNWEDKRNAQNEILNCPSCQKILPLRDWRKKLDFEENKKNDEKLLTELNKMINHSNNNSQLINENNIIEELKNECKRIKTEYNNYKDLSSIIFKKFVLTFIKLIQ